MREDCVAFAAYWQAHNERVLSHQESHQQSQQETEQLPRLPQAQSQVQSQAQAHAPDLVTCGIGANDILYSAPAKLFGDLRSLLGEVADGTVVLDLPLPAGFWWIVGRMSVPYITRINHVINEVAAERDLPVAQVSAQFTAPWMGKLSRDSFHPSQDGYRDWTRALLAAIPAATPAA